MTDEIPPVHDYSRVDAYFRSRQRVALLNASWRPMLAGAVGAALIIAAVWVALPKFSYREVVVDHVVQKDVTVDHIVPKDVTVEIPHIVMKNVEIPIPRFVAPPSAPLAAAPPASAAPETHPFAEMTDKVRVGIITSVTPRAICYDNQSNNCTWIALTGDDGRAVLDAKGQIQQDPAAVFVDVEKWLGHETWNAPSPLDPTHLTLYWVRDHEQLIQFTMGRRDASVHPGVLRLERDSPPTRIQKIRS